MRGVFCPMALLKDMFSKDKVAALNRQPSLGIPTEEVSKFRQHGLSNDQIIQNLTRTGYGLDQINNAINMVDAKEGVESIVLSPNEQMPKRGGNKDTAEFSELEEIGKGLDEDRTISQQPMQSMQQQMQPPSSMQRSFPPPFAPSSMQSTPIPPMTAGNDEKLQEIAEAIIEEKWTDLLNHVNKVVEWKNATETRMTQIEQQLTDIRREFDKLHQGVLERVGTYDSTIKDIGTEIKALEKVFQKILPNFIENVNELGRITQGLKKK